MCPQLLLLRKPKSFRHLQEKCTVLVFSFYACLLFIGVMEKQLGHLSVSSALFKMMPMLWVLRRNRGDRLPAFHFEYLWIYSNDHKSIYKNGHPISGGGFTGLFAFCTGTLAAPPGHEIFLAENRELLLLGRRDCFGDIDLTFARLISSLNYQIFLDHCVLAYQAWDKETRCSF